MAEFLGTCIDNPFGSVSKLCCIVESGKRVGRSTFLKHCPISKDEEFATLSFSVTRKDMFNYPNDFEYYSVPQTSIYYFVHSCVEFFFKGGEVKA